MLSLLEDFKTFACRLLMAHELRPSSEEHKPLSNICSMAVIDPRVDASSTVSSSRGVQTD